jgi:hypothetical protein
MIAVGVSVAFRFTVRKAKRGYECRDGGGVEVVVWVQVEVSMRV